MLNFLDYISTLDIIQLRDCRTLINKQILSLLSPPDTADKIINNEYTPGSELTLVSKFPPPPTIEKKPIEELVSGPKSEFISISDRDLLKNECKSLGFKKYITSDAVQNRFIAPFNDPYIWKSNNGPVVNKPIPIADFPIVRDLLGKVNDEFDCNLNCCLISYFKIGSSGIRLHHDSEDSLDHTQPIVVVSIGAVRRVEFIDNEHPPYLGSDLSLNPQDCSVYVMRPGTQQFFRHRVRCNKKVHKERFSFSFRAFVPAADRTQQQVPFYSTPNPNIPSSAPSTSTVTPVFNKSICKSYPAVNLFQTPEIDPNKANPVVPPQLTPMASDGYSPFPSKTVSFKSSTSQSKEETNKKLCLILGSSITLGLNGDLLSKRNRRVVNCSETGANLHDVGRMAKDFYVENPNSIGNVDQIILNVGTNDVKYFNGRDRDVFKRFRPLIINVVKSLKSMFPGAMVYFQSIIPIRIIYNYTALTVDLFNQLLFSICDQYGCIFYNCFEDFVGGWEFNNKTGTWYRDFNSKLYRDKFHLNEEGIKLLARHIKCIIYGNIFNPHPKLVYHH